MKELGAHSTFPMDVFDAVESVKSLMMDCFTADRNVCRFDPQTAEDFVPAKMATALTNYIFYRENKGSKILHDVIPRRTGC